MPLLPQAFNAGNHEPAKEFSLLPAGEYIAEIVDADVLDTKDGKGQFVKVEYELTDCEQNGAYVSRHYWDNFNLVNNSAAAMEIAERQFTSLCIAIGKMVVKNTDELVDTPALVLKIKVSKAKKDQIDKGYPDDTNETVKWTKLKTGTSEPTSSTPVKRSPAKTATPAKPTPVKTTNASHPWMK